MPDPGFLALFLVGLLGGTHCVGMCGGIVGALSFGGVQRVSLHLAYNSGRIVSYVVAGVLVGTLSGLSTVLSGQLPIRLILYVLANLMLIALGFYLMGLTRALAIVERVGQSLWRHIQPASRRFLPAHTPLQAFPLGLLWGWLPCGLVYSALATALTTGSAVRGGLSMLAFGLGTLPNLLLAGLFLVRLRNWMQQKAVRITAGMIVCGFGLWGLFGTWRLVAQVA